MVTVGQTSTTMVSYVACNCWLTLSKALISRSSSMGCKSTFIHLPLIGLSVYQNLTHYSHLGVLVQGPQDIVFNIELFWLFLLFCDVWSISQQMQRKLLSFRKALHHIGHIGVALCVDRATKLKLPRQNLSSQYDWGQLILLFQFWKYCWSMQNISKMWCYSATWFSSQCWDVLSFVWQCCWI